MRVQAVSGDLIVKLGLGLAVVGVAVYAARQLAQRASAAGEKLGQVADQVIVAVNPADERNIVNQAVNAAGAAVTGNEGFSVTDSLSNLWMTLYGPDMPSMKQEPYTPPIKVLAQPVTGITAGTIFDPMGMGIGSF